MKAKTDPISAAVSYQMALRSIVRARTLPEALKTASKALDITFDKPEEGMISVGSGFGHNTRRPFVTFAMANPNESANPTIQLLTNQAREIAIQILEAADAAESDGFIVEWLRDTADMSDGRIGALLSAFRDYRDRRRSRSE